MAVKHNHVSGDSEMTRQSKVMESALVTAGMVLFFAVLMVPGFWLRFGCMVWEA